MNLKDLVMAAIIIQVLVDVIFLGVFAKYIYNFDTLHENQEILYESDSLAAKIIPELTRSHNDIVESFVSNNPKMIDTGEKFGKTMMILADEGRLDRFEECRHNENIYQINYPLFSIPNENDSTRQIIGYETATYDMLNNYNHTESLYVFENVIIYDIFDCARLTFDPLNENNMIFYYYGDTEEVNKSVNDYEE